MANEIRRVLLVSAQTDSARLTSRSGSMNGCSDTWEVFDPRKFAAYLEDLATKVREAEAAGNKVSLDAPDNRERCRKCQRQRPHGIVDPTCDKGGYCDWVIPGG